MAKLDVEFEFKLVWVRDSSSINIATTCAQEAPLLVIRGMVAFARCLISDF